MSVGHIVLCLYLVCAYSGCFVRCLFPRVAYGACSDPVIRAFRWHRIMPGKCKFQSAWLSNDDYKLWVAPDTANPHCAKCTRCRKTFDIASMGESALKSHAKSAKHCGIMQMAAGNSMENYLAASVSGRSTGSAPSQATDLNSACKSHEVVKNNVCDLL